MNGYNILYMCILCMCCMDVFGRACVCVRARVCVCICVRIGIFAHILRTYVFCKQECICFMCGVRTCHTAVDTNVCFVVQNEK